MSLSKSALLSAAASLLFTALAFAEPPRAPKPNVLVIVLDTLRFDATSFGGRSEQTPFLASLASRSVVFTHAYSTHDFTPPSHFSLLTGLRNGLDTVDDHPQIGIAWEAKRLGYDTFGTAANVLLNPIIIAPLAAFDRYHELSAAVKSNAAAAFGAYAEIDMRLASFGLRATPHNRASVYYSAVRVLPDVAAQIRESKTPYLGFVNLTDPHEPWVPNPALYPPEKEVVPPAFQPDIITRSFNPEFAHPETITDAARRIRVQDKLRLVTSPRLIALDLTPAQLATYRARYDAEVRGLDLRLKEFFTQLANENLLDDTIVIITSDHGESFGEEDLITHNFKDRGDYESTHHVPMLIVFPPRYRVTTRVVNEKVSIADIPPTIYDLLSLDWSPLRKKYGARFGRSLLPLFMSDKPQYTAVATVPKTLGKVPTSAEEEERRKALKALGYLQ